jgi:class 3 adenylate cyclase/predicted ATPase
VEIGAWLRDLGLDRYEQAFRENDIASAVLPELTDRDLKDLGVSLGHRRLLLKAIADLAARDADVALASAAEAAPGTDRATGAERRQLTVMFVDLVGSTELAARLDPEDMGGVIRAYQGCCAEVIGRWDGHVAKYMGDGVLAYFGWPVAHEDEAERAVRAGLALSPTLAGVTTPAVQPLAARVGIATGLVMVGELIGEGAAKEQTVVGETPNLAARLQALAAPGSVVISQATRRLVGGMFELTDLGPQRIKGFAEPLNAWQVEGEGRAEGRFEALHGEHLTPLVGREHELGIVLERWSWAKDGDGQVVLLSGEPGIGKSRMIRALRERLGAEPYTPLSHYCSPHHTNSALYPIISQLERAAGLTSDDQPEARLAKLETLVGQATERLEEAVPLLAALLGIATNDRYPALNLSPQRQKQRTLEVLLEQLAGLARQRPVIELYEDLHWADPSTLELLDLLVERVRDLRALVLLTYRPEFSPPWTGQAHVTALPLNRLGRHQGAAMVARLTGGKALPDQVLAQIIAKTDGVPLFVEELTKTVLESGVLRDAGDRYELSGPVGALAIPATLHDSLMARLDRLASIRELAQTAAVIGREFGHKLLSAVSSLSDADLEAALDRLSSAELIFRRGVPPQATYAFKHALVQDAAYESLLKSRRRQLHARIAQVLEERFPETAEAQPELAAHHCAGAGLATQAIAYWCKAGIRAIQRSANAEASVHLRGGLDLLETMPATPERAKLELGLLIPLAQALSITKGRGTPETERAYARAWTLCKEVGDASQVLSIFLGLWGREFVRARFDAAEELAKQWPQLVEQVDDPSALTAITGYTRGGVAYFRGEILHAVAHFEQVLAHQRPLQHGSLARRYGIHHEPALPCHCWAAEIAWLRGNGDQALALSMAALALARELDHSPSLASGLAWTALFHLTRRDVPRAREHAEATISLATELGFPFRLAEGRIVRGWATAAVGETSAGIAELREGIDAWRATGAELSTTWWLAFLAEAYERADQPQLGLEAVTEALEIAGATGERLFAAELHRLRGGLLLLRGDGAADDEAEADFRRAIALARDQRTKLFELRAAVSLARLWQRQGRRAAAGELLAPVYGWFTEGFETADLKDAKALFDELR